MWFIHKLFISSIACLMLIFFATFSSEIFAYRTDFGKLPPGTSACARHVPVTLEVPPNASPVPDPAKGEFSNGFFHVEEIRDNLFYVTDGVYQTIFLVSSKGIILVDAPPSIGQNPQNPSLSVNLVDVVYSVPEAIGKPIRKLIYSHSHFDHIGAASFIKDAFPDVQIIAHWETKKLIKRGSGDVGVFIQGSGVRPPPLPNSVFFKRKTIRFGGQTLKLSYQGPIHEPGNIFIYAPQQKVLMLVDTLFPGWSPFNDFALAKDIPLYIESHDIALSFDFTTFVGGHLNRLGTRQDIKDLRTYIDDIRENAELALRNPTLTAIFGIETKNPLGAFHIYLDQVACDCANLTLDPSTAPSGTAWLNLLAASDINTLGHCWEMVESLRIDSSF